MPRGNPSFTKGHTKLGGRQKGTPNKENKRLRVFIAEILDSNQDKVKLELNKLEGKDFVNAILAFLEYSLPKISRVETVHDQSPSIELTQFSFEQLLELRNGSEKVLADV